jgi:hypothetical protein
MAAASARLIDRPPATASASISTPISTTAAPAAASARAVSSASSVAAASVYGPTARSDWSIAGPPISAATSPPTRGIVAPAATPAPVASARAGSASRYPSQISRSTRPRLMRSHSACPGWSTVATASASTFTSIHSTAVAAASPAHTRRVARVVSAWALTLPACPGSSSVVTAWASVSIPRSIRSTVAVAASLANSRRGARVVSAWDSQRLDLPAAGGDHGRRPS